MKVFLFLVFAGCAVKCNESVNYYVINIPDQTQRSTPFKVYWNVPTYQCASKKIPFENLFEKYGIIQNNNDSFRGEKITIMYDPGQFPAIFNTSGGELRFRNGGVPQDGDYTEHAAAFKVAMNELIPDPNYSGIAIIDFESWRPIFRQNWGALEPYKKVSYELEKKKHWWWPQNLLEGVARARYEKAGRIFMQKTLVLAKELRPRASWGYYAYPYCYNMKTNMCSAEVMLDNDRIDWLWSESTALYPSIYSSKALTTTQLVAMVTGRINEAARVTRDSPIMPYFWYRYRDGGYLEKKDLEAVLKTLYESRASGFIVWGSSFDVNTPEKCKTFLQYLNNTLGPAIAKYTKRNTNSNKTVSVTEPTPIPTTTITTTPEIEKYEDKVDFDKVVRILESMNIETTVTPTTEKDDNEVELKNEIITLFQKAMCDCENCSCDVVTFTTETSTTVDTATTATEQEYITVAEIFPTEKSHRCNLDSAIDKSTDTSMSATTPYDPSAKTTENYIEELIVKKNLCKSRMLEKIIDALPLIELATVCANDGKPTTFLGTNFETKLRATKPAYTKSHKEGCFDRDDDFREYIPDLIAVNNKDQVVRYILSLDNEDLFSPIY